MTSPAGEEGVLQRLAASAWRFRWQVEHEAAVRFDRLADRLAEVGAPAAVVALARQSAADERRHAALCDETASELEAGQPSPGEATAQPPRAGRTADMPHATAELREIAPASLALRGKVLYELVAACCITETESMAVLTTLLDAAGTPRLRAVLHELTADEVRHSRLGWAHLAAEHAAGATAFLAPLVPAMLDGNAPPDLFEEVSPERDDPRLLEYGVLPHSLKRRVFTTTLEEVIFPGLERYGVDTAPARAWLAAKQRG